MVFLQLLAAGFIMKTVAVLFIFIAIALILIILIQKGKGGGLSSALAGGMAGGLLGSKTGDFLTWVTITLVAVFLMLAVILAKFYRPTGTQPAQQATTQEQPIAPAPQQPVTDEPEQIPVEESQIPLPDINTPIE